MISKSLLVGDATVCPSCSTKLTIPPEAEQTDEEPNYELEPGAESATDGTVFVSQRYPALRTIATIARVLAWLLLIVGVIVFFALVSERNAGSGSVVLAIGSLSLGIVGFVLILAFAELIAVMIDAEENTRTTCELLRKQRGSGQNSEQQ